MVYLKDAALRELFLVNEFLGEERPRVFLRGNATESSTMHTVLHFLRVHIIRLAETYICISYFTEIPVKVN
jgi:hypothetical protein